MMAPACGQVAGAGCPWELTCSCQPHCRPWFFSLWASPRAAQPSSQHGLWSKNEHLKEAQVAYLLGPGPDTVRYHFCCAPLITAIAELIQI
jgi:hypothetical protein